MQACRKNKPPLKSNQNVFSSAGNAVSTRQESHLLIYSLVFFFFFAFCLTIYPFFPTACILSSCHFKMIFTNKLTLLIVANNSFLFLFCNIILQFEFFKFLQCNFHTSNLNILLATIGRSTIISGICAKRIESTFKISLCQRPYALKYNSLISILTHFIFIYINCLLKN